MYQLQNTQLTIDVLDPLADQHRFGVRYCTGGYIFQVSDQQHGALMSGPTYPDSFNWFDGQGIPDAFNWSPLRAEQGDDSEVEIIGIGRCNLFEKRVIRFCEWTVATSPKQISMSTQQQFADFDLRLERTISLHGRTVRSHSTLSNHGERFIPLSWFPHPFYPQPDSDELCRLNAAVTMPDNAGYRIASNGYIQRKAAPDPGFYQALDHQAQSPLVIMQRHPLLGMVGASCSYIPTFFPIWGNQYTFSWEPFFERLVAPGQRVSWWIDYDF